MSQSGLPTDLWEAFGAIRGNKDNFVVVETPEGEVLSIKRRILPNPDTLPVKEHLVIREGMRPDLVAWQALGNPLAYNKVADVNAVLSPFDLTNKPGHTIKIPE